MQGKALARGGDCSEPSSVLCQKLKPGPGKDAGQVAGHQRARIHSAMLELVAESGYDAVTVRELARAAGVSTRSFYKHYSSKEQCFLRVLQLVIQRMLRLIEFPPEGTADERIRLSVERMVGALVADPRAARLLCVDAYAAGPLALKHAESGRRSFEMAIDESVGRKPEASRPSLTAEAVVAGLYGAVRGYQLKEEKLSSAHLRKTLVSWVIVCAESFSQVDRLKSVPPLEGDEFGHHSDEIASRKEYVGGVGSSKGDRTALLTVAAKFASAENYQELSLSKLVKAAGVSRRAFDANFSSLDECLVGALELKAVDAVARVREAGQSGLSPEEGVYRAVASLCDQVAGDQAFGKLCFEPTVAPGLPKMRFQLTMIDEFALMVAGRLEASWRVEQSAARVSVGAVWGVIQNQVASGKAHGLLRKAPALTYLLLAPIVGSSVALKAIGRDHANDDLMSVCRDNKAVLGLIDIQAASRTDQ